MTNDVAIEIIKEKVCQHTNEGIKKYCDLRERRKIGFGKGAGAMKGTLCVEVCKREPSAILMQQIAGKLTYALKRAS